MWESVLVGLIGGLQMLGALRRGGGVFNNGGGTYTRAVLAASHRMSISQIHTYERHCLALYTCDEDTVKNLEGNRSRQKYLKLRAKARS
jgi:hypothetical protein